MVRNHFSWYSKFSRAHSFYIEFRVCVRVFVIMLDGKYRTDQIISLQHLFNVRRQQQWCAKMKWHF